MSPSCVGSREYLVTGIESSVMVGRNCCSRQAEGEKGPCKSKLKTFRGNRRFDTSHEFQLSEYNYATKNFRKTCTSERVLCITRYHNDSYLIRIQHVIHAYGLRFMSLPTLLCCRIRNRLLWSHCLPIVTFNLMKWLLSKLLLVQRLISCVT